jgi:hypothetical protein
VHQGYRYEGAGIALPASIKRIFFRHAALRRRRRSEFTANSAWRISRIDHVIDCKVRRDVQRFATLIEPGHHLVEFPFALDRIDYRGSIISPQLGFSGGQYDALAALIDATTILASGNPS